MVLAFPPQADGCSRLRLGSHCNHHLGHFPLQYPDQVIILQLGNYLISCVRVNEVSYLTSVRELLDTWSLVSRSSSCQQLTWFPFTELVVITHTSELDRWVYDCM